MNNKKQKVKVNIANSFEEADQWDFEYEQSLSPEQRHHASLLLKKRYCKKHNIEFNKIKPIARVFDEDRSLRKYVNACGSNVIIKEFDKNGKLIKETVRKKEE